MATSVTLNGTTYQIPAEGDFNWGTELSNYFIAISTSVLQKTGGSFTLTSEVNFGATYGVKSAYLKSQAANPASAGVIRLGNAENISWRNQANNGDLALTVNASNQLAYNGTKVILSGAIVNADVDAAAAIAYSKLNLSGSIVNADVNASAAIAVSKLAAVTASRLLVSDASGFLSASSVTSAEAAYLSGVTSAIQTQLNAKAPSASPTFTGTVTLPATVTGASAQVITLPTSTSTLATIGLTETFTGSKTFNDNGFTLQDNSDNTKKLNFELSGITTATTRTLTVPNANGTMAINPMTTGGDLIYGGASGVETRLANGSSGNYLRSSGGTSAPTWGTPIGGWTSFTPSGSWITNTTYTGFKRKVGEDTEYQVYITLSGAPTSSSLTITIPDTIDTAKLASSTSGNNHTLGIVNMFDTSAAFNYGGQVSYNTTTTVAIKCNVVAGSYIRLGSVTQAEPFTFASGDAVFICFKVPISGQTL